MTSTSIRAIITFSHNTYLLYIVLTKKDYKYIYLNGDIMEIFTSFILTTIAGLSTCLGYLFTYIKSSNKDKIICIFLSFSMGVMILISIKELIPIPLKYIYLKYNFNTFLSILLIIPIYIYIIINYLNNNVKNNNSLYRVGVLNTVSMVLHNILEGIVTFFTTLTNYQLGIKLGLAIMAHNIPEGISIAIPIYYSTKSRGRAFFYTLLAGSSEVIGALLFYLVFKNNINIDIINIILYTIGCLMIIISIKEILPEVLKYGNKTWILMGIILSLFILVDL